jgi:hypothetical protein
MKSKSKPGSRHIQNRVDSLLQEPVQLDSEGTLLR